MRILTEGSEHDHKIATIEGKANHKMTRSEMIKNSISDMSTFNAKAKQDVFQNEHIIEQYFCVYTQLIFSHAELILLL